MKVLDELSRKINLITKQFLILLLYLGLAITLGVIFNKLLNSNNFYIANLSYLLIDLITLIIFLFIFRKTIIPDFSDFKKNWRKYINKYFIYWVIGLAVMVISNIIISSFISMPTNEAGNREILKTLPIYSLIAMIGIAPIVEELLTRVYLKDAFKHTIIYVILSGLIFGSLHMLSIGNNLLQLLYIIPYGALGCALAKMYADSNNIWINIFFHSFHNFICILLIFIGELI